MTFSDEQKSAIKSIFKEASFVGLEKGKFIFSLVSSTSSFKIFLKNLGSPSCFIEHACLKELALSASSGGLSPRDLMDVILEWTEENTVVEESFSAAVTSMGPDSRVRKYMETLIPAVVINKKAKDKTILLDPAQGYRPITGLDVDVYLKINGLDWDEMLREDKIKKVVTCFDPYTTEYLFDREEKTSGVMMTHVNYYVPPRWRFLDVKPAYTGFIKGLIEHLFPIEEEREFVLDWLHYAITKRNETVLCLIGARGTGKGILLNNLMAALVGTEYHAIAKQDVLTEKFNSEFDNKRFVFFDEVNVSTEKSLNRFKQLANAKISMERKGEDSETVDNFVSMALSSNDKRDFLAEPQERRFSVPRVTEVPLLQVFTEEEIEQFCIDIATPESETVAEFGNWLIKRVPRNSSLLPLKGGYYFELCKYSMALWKLFLIEHIIEFGILDTPIENKILELKFNTYVGANSEDKKNNSPTFPSRHLTVENFIGDYLHEGVCRVGKVVDIKDKSGKRKKAVLPSTEFLMRYGYKYNSPSNDPLDDL